MEIKTVVSVMDFCREYFAALYERVKGASVDSATVQAEFAGKYQSGDLLRIHGAYTSDYGGFDAGDVYEVVSFRDGVITLDRPLHTRGTYLFIAYLEPPASFVALCEDIAAYEQQSKTRKGLASESIDGYSWSKDGAGDCIEAAFKDELKPYRSPAPTRLYYARNARPWR